MFTKTSLIFLLCAITSVLGQKILYLDEGEICNGTGTGAWKCEYASNCTHVRDFRRNRPAICNFDGLHPIICCPPIRSQRLVKSNTLVTNGNAEKYCSEYMANICRMGISKVSRRSTNISTSGERGFKPLREVTIQKLEPLQVMEAVTARTVHEVKAVKGGINSPPRIHKHMVLVGYGAGNSKSWECGGSLISERWVLSAAHCANPKPQGPAQWARVGELDLSTTDEDARPQEKRIVQRIVHPDYKNPAVYNDIALFKVDSDYKFTEWVAPVCIHPIINIPVSRGTVTGWGRLDFVGDVSPHLQEVNIPLVNGTECRRLYENNKDSRIPQGIKAEIMICAGEKEGGKDACSGDSGGPLSANPLGHCLMFQLGIVSFGRDCGLPDTPGVYTRVSYYLPWIESIVWPLETND